MTEEEARECGRFQGELHGLRAAYHAIEKMLDEKFEENEHTYQSHGYETGLKAAMELVMGRLNEVDTSYHYEFSSAGFAIRYNR